MNRRFRANRHRGRRRDRRKEQTSDQTGRKRTKQAENGPKPPRSRARRARNKTARTSSSSSSSVEPTFPGKPTPRKTKRPTKRADKRPNGPKTDQTGRKRPKPPRLRVGRARNKTARTASSAQTDAKVVGDPEHGSRTRCTFEKTHRKETQGAQACNHHGVDRCSN